MSKALSQSTSLPRPTVSALLNGIASLYTDSATRSHDVLSFKRTVAPYQLSEIVVNELVSIYDSNKDGIKEFLPGRVGRGRYEDFDYRCDVPIATRSIRSGLQGKMEFSCDIRLTGGGEGIKFMADRAQMGRMRDEIERAVREVGEVHAMRFQRYMY